MEESFWRWRYWSGGAVLDSFTGTFAALLHAGLAAAAFRGKFGDMATVGCTIGMTCLFSLFTLGALFAPKLLYKRRSWIVACIRVCWVLTGRHLWMASFGAASQAAPPTMSIIWRGPITPAALGALGFQLPFPQHLLVQITVLFISFSGVENACMVHGRGPHYIAFFQEFERKVDKAGWPVADAVAGGGQEPPLAFQASPNVCWMVVNFIILWAGFMGPTVIVYVIECFSRVSFVSAVQTDRKRIIKMFSFSKFVWVVNLVVFFEVSWRYLKVASFK